MELNNFVWFDYLKQRVVVVLESGSLPEKETKDRNFGNKKRFKMIWRTLLEVFI